MAAYAFFVIICAAMVTVKADVRALMLTQAEWHEACAVETGFTGDPVATWTALDSDKREGRCYIGCMLEKWGVIVDGRFCVQNAKKMAATFYQGDRLKLSETILEMCNQEVAALTDRCDSGPNAVKCIRDKKIDLGLEEW